MLTRWHPCGGFCGVVGAGTGGPFPGLGWQVGRSGEGKAGAGQCSLLGISKWEGRPLSVVLTCCVCLTGTSIISCM